MSDEQATKTVSISSDLYESIEKRVGETGFNSVEEYVTFILEEVLKDEEEEEQISFSEEEEDEVRKRLRALGYLD